MKLIKSLFLKKNDKSPKAEIPRIECNEYGVIYKKSIFIEIRNKPIATQKLFFYLQQLEEEDYVFSDSDNLNISWEKLFLLLRDDNHTESLDLLSIPKLNQIKPIIVSSGSLADSDFKVVIKGWRSSDGKDIANASRVGAILELDGQQVLMNESSWNCLSAIKNLHQQQLTNPGVDVNKNGWAEIRKYALDSNAVMDGFLYKTIVLKPESLQLKLNKSEITSDSVIEISPQFDGQPDNWLEIFDQYSTVQDQYHIAATDGSITHLIVEPSVKVVLETIKKMPGRRIAGDKALTFLKNPFATLGEDAENVINEVAYEAELDRAGIYFYKFSVEPNLDATGTKIENISLELTATSKVNETPKFATFQNPNEYNKFLSGIRGKFDLNLPCAIWKCYELELSDLTEEQLCGLERLSKRWSDELSGQAFEEVFDLTQYGDRVVGIGIAKRVSSNLLKKEKAENWISGVHLDDIGFDGEILSKWENATYDDYLQFEENIKTAISSGDESVFIPGIELELPIKKAEIVSQAWARKFAHSNEAKPGNEEKLPKIKTVLLIDDNIEVVNYLEKRERLLAFNNLKPRLPKCLKIDTVLKEHQLYGVAWLQNLFGKAPHHVTGCLLADDMGLGKTIQLLSFMLEYLESSPNAKPCLIVAPVSLLDNWENELNKFFDAHEFELIKLYGKTLAESKYSRNQIPANVQAKGIQNLLKKGWISDAKIVLTTYETLRDQQFSLAQQHWSIVICDESQKIKTPGTLVTEAAKAVAARADFKIACTGTPVENSLNDLWCLFDFIQAGFLGSLNEFARNFKKPIECETDKDRFAIKRLRELVAPQILRRMKSEVAKDLKPKTEDSNCKSIAISNAQDKLYKASITDYESNRDIKIKMGEPAGAMILGLLHRLKMICAHPISIILSADQFEISPKMNWLKNTLLEIKKNNEKVIIFTELRGIQRDIQLMLIDTFDINAKIINGDTNSSSEKGATRQTIINEFQLHPGFGVIILSTTAVGFGVNVQAANHVIHFTRPWNPAKEDQATDRAYRIGQEKEVFVYYPTIVSNNYITFEKTLDSLLAKKRELAGDMLNGYDEIKAADFINPINLA